MTDIKWEDPWFSVGDEPDARDRLEKELYRELPHGHILEGRQCHAVACRIDNDDVLFVVDEGPGVAVVHLSHSPGRETNPAWPHTQLFATARDFESTRFAQDVADYQRASDDQ